MPGTWKLYHGAVHHGPVGAHPIPDEAVVAFCWMSVHHKKRCNTHVPGTDTRVTGHACRVTGAQAMAVAGGGLVNSGLLSVELQGCVAVRSGLPLVLRNRCRGQGHEKIASNGGA